MPPPRDNSGMRSGASVGIGLGLGLASGLGSIADSLADGLVGGGRAPRSREMPEARPGPNAFEIAANEASRDAISKRQDDEAEWRKRQEERYWE